MNFLLLADMFIMARAEGLSSAREGFDRCSSCVAAGDGPTESHGLRRSSTVHLVDVIWERESSKERERREGGEEKGEKMMEGGREGKKEKGETEHEVWDGKRGKERGREGEREKRETESRGE